MNSLRLETASVVAELPTRQRNALSIMLDKSDFIPADVASLSYRQISKAPGIGRKGMVIILAWLAEFGLALSGQPEWHASRPVSYKRLQQAIHMLERHGYRILPPAA